MLTWQLSIEGESSIADNVIYSLEAEGYVVTWVSEGEKGLEVLRQNNIDRVVGFEIGGDDYVVKPFSPRELVARVKVILRRGRSDYSDQKANSVGDSHNDGGSLSDDDSRCEGGTAFKLDEEKRQINFCNNVLVLTTYEYGILCILLKHPERVYSREQLMNAVWPSPEEIFERAVDTHIKMLRAKLRAVNPNDNSLVTHRGIGYSLKLS